MLRVTSEGKLIVNLTRGSVVCDQVVIADRPRRRMRGLLGRQSLPAGEGMLLQPAPSIHTAFMRFAIDVVFMDGTLQVRKIVRDLPPWRTASARHAWAVLELGAGQAAVRGIEIGHYLGVVELSDMLGAFDVGAAWHANWTGFANGAVDRKRGAHGASDRPARQGHTMIEQALQESTRVLVVAPDRRFRAVTAALLARRGCEVTLGEQAENVADLARRERAEVVVLDAGRSLTGAPREAAQIEKLDPPTGVVVVSEEPGQELPAMPVLAKWGSFDGLCGAIEDARSARHARSLDGQL